MTNAQVCGCENCGMVGMRIPDETGEYGFGGVDGAIICVEPSGSCVVHFDGVEKYE